MIETTAEKTAYLQSLIDDINNDLINKQLTEKQVIIKKQLLNNYRLAINNLNRFKLKNLI
ncbi:hypothetical protein [Methylomonas rivi]|uniref:Uncharacterized protein n=1 Tax=Methylomonas rivi TaxID=2952226 RepID=A0ABT1U9P7_9GAMM|nr:hypothetical protein [Methylomonas sp. WSC-6]MCQ8130512.1 hypothetical protein [Methylomonas sp. WSC-6]